MGSIRVALIYYVNCALFILCEIDKETDTSVSSGYQNGLQSATTKAVSKEVRAS